ncbi:MAG: AAA family ATPase [Thermoplasmatota archaeon]
MPEEESPDQTDTKNERIAKLQSELEDTRRRLYNAEEKTRELEMVQSKYEDAFAKIRKPPLIHAYVVRRVGPDLEPGQLVVARGGDLLKVEAGEINIDNLSLGQYVWVHPQTYAVIQPTAEKNEGLLGKIIEILEDGNKLVVSTEGDMSRRIIPCPPEFRSQAKIGYQVALLPPTMDILDIMPNWDVKMLLLGERPSVLYRDIGGLSAAIERIRDVIELPYKEKELFDRVRLQAPRGILLYGPPGCGKTLLVKAVASENRMTFFNVSIADILSKWVGESERIVKELFKQAKERRPSIIFFDEIEALFTVRGLLDTSGVHKNIIAQILSEMDGILDLRDVYVIGATNRPDLVDPALLRPRRFDEIIEIPRPDRRAAEEILAIYLTEDLPIEEGLVRRLGGREAAARHLREVILDEIYGKDRWITVKLSPDAKEGVKTVLRRDIISGAILEAIVSTVKKNFIKRALGKSGRERERDGLREEDIAQAVEEECREHAITELQTLERRQRELRKALGSDPMVG